MAAIPENPSQLVPAGAVPAAAGAGPIVGGPGGMFPKPFTGDFKSTSLYVGDLAPDVAETALFEVFNAVALVSTIRVCRSALTRESLGYAYVNFQTPGDAEKALTELNYTPIKGRPCRIMWSQRDPTARRTNVGNVFIKNLAPEITSKELHDTFKLFGEILSCKVAVAPTGASKGYGFVHFETEESARSAIAGVNGMEFGGRPVVVTPYVAKPSRQGPDWNNLYIKNVPKHWTEETVKETFGKYGEIVSTKLAKDDNDNLRGFGFVCFREHTGATAAVEALNGLELEGEPASTLPSKAHKAGGKEADKDKEKEKKEEAALEGRPKLRLYVGRAQKKGERERTLKDRKEATRREHMLKYQGCNLYVRNLDESVDDETLRKEFAPFGTITSARIDRDPEGRSRLFGYVCFSSPEEATKAVQVMNHKLVQGKPLYVALWQPKEQRASAVAAAPARNNPTFPGARNTTVLANGPGVASSSMQQLAQMGGVNPMQMLNPLLANMMAMQSNPAMAAMMSQQQGGARNPAEQQAQFAQQLQHLQQLMMVNPVAYYQLMAAFAQSGGRMAFNPAAGSPVNGRGMPGAPAAGRPTQAQGGMAGNYVPFNPQGGAMLGAAGMAPGAFMQQAGRPGGGGGRRTGMPVQQQQQQQPVPQQMAGPGGARIAAGPGSGQAVSQQPQMQQVQGQMSQQQPQVQQQMRGPMSGGPQAGGMRGPQVMQQQQQQPQQQQAGTAAGAQRVGPSGMPQQGGVRGPITSGAGALPAPGQGMPMQMAPTSRSDFAALLASATPQQQKNMIGEQLYGLISETQPDLVGKITGMLLDGMETSELLHLLESPQDLKARIQEAIDVLKQHEEASKKAAGVGA